MQAARALIANHIAWRVVTRRSLGQLDDLKVLILSNVHHLSEEEVGIIRGWVRRGGAVYVSGATSLVRATGHRQPDLMLAEVLGVSLRKADWSDRDHYISPCEAGREDFPEWDERYPAFIRGPAMEVEARAEATVLATRTLPWPAPDSRSFSSIHSNPPWTATELPEVVLNRAGAGRSVYCASILEEAATLQETFIRLLRRLSGPLTLEVRAHPTVEVTLFRQPDRRRHLLALASFQHELPNLPLDGIEVRLRLSQRVNRVRVLPGGQALRLRRGSDSVTFTVSRLETLALLAVEHA